jgi:hypothetical protein
MTGNGQRLREEIRHIVEAADEEDTEVSLADSVPYPWETVSAAMLMPISLSQNNGVAG